jgi:hypothetical protein
MNDYRPIGVISFILVIVLTGVVFFYPANSPEKAKPTVEIISEK